MLVTRFVFVLCLFFFYDTFGADWNPKVRKPVRSRLLECLTLLVPVEALPDNTVGIELSSNRIDDFRREMAEAVRERGAETLRGSQLYVTGVEKSGRSRVLAEYQQVLAELGFEPGSIEVEVLDIPRSVLQARAVASFRELFERLAYFFPSLRLDYQGPIYSELVSGLAAAAAIEATNVVYLYKSLPLLDAHLTVGTHAAVLTLYIVYKKFMVNWLLRPGTRRVESFLKQCLVSVPFIVNYGVFGKFSQIAAFVNDRGWDAALHRFPYELTHFASTQGVSVFLQTLFYTLVITKGVRGWENAKEGARESRAARVLSNLITVPILSVDAFLLAFAAANSHPLANLGAFDLNLGHVGLAILTAVGSALWVFPSILDPTIGWYEAVEAGIRRAQDFFRGPRPQPQPIPLDRASHEPERVSETEL